MVAISLYPPLLFAPHRLPVTHHGSLTSYWWPPTTERPLRNPNPHFWSALFVSDQPALLPICLCLFGVGDFSACSLSCLTLPSKAVSTWAHNTESTVNTFPLQPYMHSKSSFSASLCISVSAKCLQCKCFSSCVCLCVWDVCGEESPVHVWLVPGVVIMGVRGFLIGVSTCLLIQYDLHQKCNKEPNWCLITNTWLRKALHHHYCLFIFLYLWWHYSLNPKSFRVTQECKEAICSKNATGLLVAVSFCN